MQPTKKKNIVQTNLQRFSSLRPSRLFGGKRKKQLRGERHLPHEADPGFKLIVMSFNIRRGTARDGKNHWVFRRNLVQDVFNQYRPDVLGLQEALDFQIDEIRTMLPGYEKVGSGNLGGSRGLHTAVFYNARRFYHSAEDTFWFSDTPAVAGSRGWGNAIPRTCTWVRLIEKKTGQAFYFYNVHLDHLSLRARKNSVVFLSRFINNRPSPDPFILTGDFNARERSAPVEFLKGKRPLRVRNKGFLSNPEPLADTFRIKYPDVRRVVTFHGFGRYFFRMKLDYIFVPASVFVTDAKIIKPQGKRLYPSDHYPLLADISLPQPAAHHGFKL